MPRKIDQVIPRILETLVHRNSLSRLVYGLYSLHLAEIGSINRQRLSYPGTRDELYFGLHSENERNILRFELNLSHS